MNTINIAQQGWRYYRQDVVNRQTQQSKSKYGIILKNNSFQTLKAQSDQATDIEKQYRQLSQRQQQEDERFKDLSDFNPLAVVEEKEQEEQIAGFEISRTNNLENQKERVYLVGIKYKQPKQKYTDAINMTEYDRDNYQIENEEDMRKSYLQKHDNVHFSLKESLEELGRLAETAGCEVVGFSSQAIEAQHVKTYVGKGKLEEIKQNALDLQVDTVIFDDELSPTQGRNLEIYLNDGLEEERLIRVCDRTALILDIFQQRAQTKEGKLQVQLAQLEYQMPRQTRMWTHLERQSGGGVNTKGMGEKQIEIDRRIIRKEMDRLQAAIKNVREQRSLNRSSREKAEIPVISMVGYTNAGKSTLLNFLTGSETTAEDKLFATLDPINKKVMLPSGIECIISDTVGFIQKLPTQLVAAFRATLEQISYSQILLHVVDISHPNSIAQAQAVIDVLKELDIVDIPQFMVWNKMDLVDNPNQILRIASQEQNISCVSSKTGEGLEGLLEELEGVLKADMPRMKFYIPFKDIGVESQIKRRGIVEKMQFESEGIYITANVSKRVASKYQDYAID